MAREERCYFVCVCDVTGAGGAKGGSDNLGGAFLLRYRIRWRLIGAMAVAVSGTVLVTSVHQGPFTLNLGDGLILIFRRPARDQNNHDEAVGPGRPHAWH